MKKKCNKHGCNKRGEFYVRKRIGLSLLCEEHKIQLLEKRDKKKKEVKC